MIKLFIRLLLSCAGLFLTANGQSYTEKYRLQLHYSLPSGWANDPNGLIYFDGFYHLFYQHNPTSTVFGPMHWGHARSPNLIHWETLPIALKPYEKGVIFSGCCILDTDNVTGIAPDQLDGNLSEIPVIAIYTLASNESQTQAMAYSLDKGLTWSQYDKNPILPNPDIADFRDPNIFERNGIFYMTLAVTDRISFYSSVDLKSWNHLDDFGLSPNEGDKCGVWECPSLFSLSDDQGNEHDILFVSENGQKCGSLLQYFIGKFNGTRFNSYDSSKVLWADNGFDNYAAIPYHNVPSGRVVIIGWLSNWLYAQSIPTSKWRGQMTIPRQLALQTVDGNLHLIQRPVGELDSIIDASRKWSLSTPLEITGEQTVDLTSQIPFKTGSMLSLDYRFNVGNVSNGKIGLNFSNDFGEFVSFQLDISGQIYEFDRRNSGDDSFSPRFSDTLRRTKRIRTSNLISGRIILDTASIEIFADDGLNTFSAIFFPTEPFENLAISGAIEDSGKSVTVETLSVDGLNSIWK